MVLCNPLLTTEFLCRLSEFPSSLQVWLTFKLVPLFEFFLHKISLLSKDVCVLDPPLELDEEIHYGDQGYLVYI